ncbi:MAG: tRNA (adenosine(37)-N6)-threonylcarbamoyltransferase complex ATPase subunit type 1 TsaE [Chlamydiae bacterium RIFCSPHIGHO2_12_FULL_49_11]|nr:MAG: tRNA (adenosine(37)-N6)-threonylcarbamoyltransferase complex ATPase subunit type 1 TsaE [Chlamydiae bacterium RIFCSPHIGHO2_12_FULL_49_11]
MAQGPFSFEVTVHSLDGLKKVALSLTPYMIAGSVFALHGDLGSGKTTFVKQLAPIFTLDSSQITSPTFGYQHLYATEPQLCHFDLYRISSTEEFMTFGFKEFLEPPYVTFIEWPDVIESLLPKAAIHIYFFHVDENTRKLRLEKHT